MEGENSIFEDNNKSIDFDAIMKMVMQKNSQLPGITNNRKNSSISKQSKEKQTIAHQKQTANVQLSQF